MAEEVKEKKTTKKVAEEKVEKVAKAKTVKAEATTETKAKKAPAKKATKTNKSKMQEFQGTGKRKTSVARVRVSVGTGIITVNGQKLDEYFDLATLVAIVRQPLVLTETDKSVDIVANIYGGGKSGQAGALRHGITRALIEFRPELRAELKKAGLVTRDARKKERKKYGLKKARRAPQFSKH